jgi:ABC-type transport system involved in multi-copper enzyme maturation permease subunit
VKAALWIGYYSFLETVRNRLLLGILVMVLPVFAGAWMMDVYHLDLQVKFIKDLGLGVVSGFGLLIVLIISLDQILPDLEKRTVYFILSRSPSRLNYILGRFFGVAASLAFYHLIMTGCLFLFLRLYFQHWFWELPLGGVIVFLKQTLLVAVILLLCTFSSKIVVLSLGTLVYVLGHFFDVFRMWAVRKANVLLQFAVEGLAFLFPDFSLFEPRISVVHDLPIAAGPLLTLAGYTLLLSLFYLIIGARLLDSRDL